MTISRLAANLIVVTAPGLKFTLGELATCMSNMATTTKSMASNQVMQNLKPSPVWNFATSSPVNGL